MTAIETVSDERLLDQSSEEVIDKMFDAFLSAYPIPYEEGRDPRDGIRAIAAVLGLPSSPNTESRESQMVVIDRDESGKPTIWCDPEIVDLVTALNAGGLKTVASCSGHGHRPGFIALADGRWLFVATEAERHTIDAAFPVDINGLSRRSEVTITDEMVERAARAMEPMAFREEFTATDEWYELEQEGRNQALGRARAALTAALASPPSPAEVTDAMVDAAIPRLRNLNIAGKDAWRNAVRAALLAALDQHGKEGS